MDHALKSQNWEQAICKSWKQAYHQVLLKKYQFILKVKQYFEEPRYLHKIAAQDKIDNLMSVSYFWLETRSPLDFRSSTMINIIKKLLYLKQ